jgi:hypothetical protein
VYCTLHKHARLRILSTGSKRLSRHSRLCDRLGWIRLHAESVACVKQPTCGSVVRHVQTFHCDWAQVMVPHVGVVEDGDRKPSETTGKPPHFSGSGS